MNDHPTPPQAHEREPTADKTSSKPLTVEIDFEYYERYLTDYDMSEDEKREFILRFAAIMLSFIDLGFNIAPGQIPIEDSGESFSQIDDLLTEFIADHTPDMLYSEPCSNNFIDESAATHCATEGSES